MFANGTVGTYCTLLYFVWHDQRVKRTFISIFYGAVPYLPKCAVLQQIYL